MIAISDYRKPSKLKEALELLSSGDYSPIAGGTDIIPQLRSGKPKKLLDIGLLELAYIKEDGEYIEIGGGATHTQINLDKSVNKYLPILSKATGLVGSWQIRNRGTIGGNIVNASPCADSAPALLIYDAEITLVSLKGKRKISLNDFIEGPYLTGIRPDELLQSIRCVKASEGAGYSYIKLGRRQAVNISRMTLAATIAREKNGIVKQAAVAGGSIFPKPSRIPEIEQMLTGNKISNELIGDAAKLAAELMIKESGERWSTPYKEPVLIGLMERALREAAGL